MKLSILASVISLAQAVQLQAEDPAPFTDPFELVHHTDDILAHLDEEFGTSVWVPPVETRGTFEADLNAILDDFYDEAGAAWGTGAYGEFYEHGGYGDADWDWGLDPHGVPVHQHSHFWYNGDYGHPEAADWEHAYVEVDYPEEQAYSYQVEPTIQWTALERALPPQYQRPAEHYDHVDHLGLENEWAGFYIEDYFGSPGWDHRHFNYENMPDFHNHHLHDPYASERRYQPHPEEYYVPIVVDTVPAAPAPAPEPEAPASTAPDLGAETPLDLAHYLSGDHHRGHHYAAPTYSSYTAPSKVVHREPARYLEPVVDDLSFLWEHKPHLPAYGHSAKSAGHGPKHAHGRHW